MQNSSQGGKRSRGKRSKVAGIAIAILFVLYTAVAPRLNERFNLDLPLPGQAREVANQAAPDRSVPTDRSVPNRSVPNRSVPNRSVPEPSRSIPASVPSSASSSGSAAEIPTASDSQRSSINDASTSESSRNDASTSESSRNESPGTEIDQSRNWLRETSPNVYLSPAGLIYGPGSAEGHRLEHVRRHAADIPDRRGPHGVFEGGFLTSLKTIDDAWSLAKQSVQTEKKVDGRRTIYKVDLQRKIGFIGGSTGKSRGRPPVSVVLLVLEGNRVITAYPVESQR